MKKTLVLTMILALASAACAFATPTLLYDYFGVSQLSVNGYHHFNQGWNPTRGFFMHEDWGSDGNIAPDPGSSYPVAEAFDIEAMYMDFDQSNSQLVYSIVTSMPNIGFNNVFWYPGYVFRTGDIRFTIGTDQYVVSTFDNVYHGFDYTAGQLYLNPNMAYYEGFRGFVDRGNPVLASYSQAGRQLATSSDFYFNYLNTGVQEHGYGTYLIEGKIGFADLGGWENLQNGVTMTLGMSCNNDVASLAAVPEPATITLLGLGLAGLFGIKRRLKR